MAEVNAIRERILDTASLLFQRRGYELVGVNEIIKTSEVAKATFYHHFTSKEQLCLEWLRLEKEKAEANSQQILDSSEDAEVRIKKKYNQLELHLLIHDYRGCPFSNTKVMVPESEEITDLIVSYKKSAQLFWEQIAIDANMDEMMGSALFLLYSGATSEAQNISNLSPLNSAVLASCALLGV